MLRVLVLARNFPNELNPIAGTFVLEQICALRRLGVQIFPVAPTPWAPPLLTFLPRVRKYTVITARSECRGFLVHRPRLLVLPREWPFSLSGLSYYLGCRRQVAKLVKENQIDLIHAHTIMPDGFAAVLLGREFNLPVVCTAHGSDINIYPHRSAATRWATKWALQRVDRLIAVSEHLQSNIFRLAGIPSVQVVRNGADSELFGTMTKLEARTRLGLPVQETMVLFVGRLVEIKEIPVLLQAMAQLGSPARLYLVGEGEMKQQLIERAKELGIADRCSFVGNRTHEEIAIWLSAANCFVLCSRMEGLPTVLPEAMMCQTPVIATSVGGIPEVIKDRETGLLVPHGDSMALARAMRLILTDPLLAASLGKRASEVARRELTWKANAQKTLSVYYDTLGAKQLSAHDSLAIPVPK
jgi:teichuronic acid biosynthesis glycosyltransferase TuaC